MPPREMSHGARAAGLLRRMRTAPYQKQPRGKSDTPPDDSLDGAEQLPLPRLIHALHTLAGLPVIDAIAASHALIKGQCNTRARLRRVSAPELESLRCGKASAHDRIVQALHTLATSRGVSDAERSVHEIERHRSEQLRREYGDVNTTAAAPDTALGAVLDEKSLRGRHVVVNRAPVLLAWSVVVLQQLGFATQEALSIGACYMRATAVSRAASIGRESGAPPLDAGVSANQPHIELMGKRIPVMHMRNGEYRGMYAGEVYAPEDALKYLKRSLFQTLPLVVGAMMLLASSVADTQGNDALSQRAYSLYVDMRPGTDGTWGKRARLDLDVILELRAKAAA